MNWKPASSVKYLRQSHQDLIDLGGVETAQQLRALERGRGNRVSYKQSWRAMKAAQSHSLTDHDSPSNPESSTARHDPGLDSEGPPEGPPELLPRPSLSNSSSITKEPEPIRRTTFKEIRRQRLAELERSIQVEADKHEEWLLAEAQRTGRGIPPLWEDKYMTGLERFTNSLVPHRYRRVQSESDADDNGECN